MELFRALGALAEPPGPAHARLGGLLGLTGAPEPAAHTELFLLNAYPYASVYLGAEGMLGGEARDRVAGFWRALGLAPPPEPDHLSALLGLYAALTERMKERREEEADPAPRVPGEPGEEHREGGRAESGPAEADLWARARRALLREHLLPWLPPYLLKVEELGSPFYEGWARLLRESLREEAEALGVLADAPDRSNGGPNPRPPGEAGPRAAPPRGAEAAELLPLHLREAPPLPDPAQGSGTPEEFLEALLAPVRSGLILWRTDLARAARELGLGARIGSRAFVLRALFSQHGPATLGWLAAEARRWAERHRSLRGMTRIAAGFWAERAARTAAVLERLGAA
ncbi:MAG: molecular chaperone TorD family protein [Gemmatimonadota bacterium]